jgi:hypothetical protein
LSPPSAAVRVQEFHSTVPIRPHSQLPEHTIRQVTLPIYILPGLLPACVLQVSLPDLECLHNPCLSPACSLPHTSWITELGSLSPTHQYLVFTLTSHSNSCGACWHGQVKMSTAQRVKGDQITWQSSKQSLHSTRMTRA